MTIWKHGNYYSYQIEQRLKNHETICFYLRDLNKPS